MSFITPSIMQASTTLKKPAPGAAEPSLPWEPRLARMGLKRYCAFAAAIALAGSAALFGLATFLNHLCHFTAPFHDPAGRPGVGTVFGNVLFAPVVETALLIGLLKLLVRCRLSETAAVTVSAIVWGILHGTQHPLRFFGTVWSFAVFGYGYFLWHRRQPRRGFAAASVPHALINTAVTVAMFVEYYSG